jgi:hypothetical protein
MIVRLPSYADRRASRELTPRCVTFWTDGPTILQNGQQPFRFGTYLLKAPKKLRLEATFPPLEQRISTPWVAGSNPAGIANT